MEKKQSVEIGTIWSPVKPYNPDDPVQKALDKLKEISEIKLLYVDCKILSVTPLPEQSHPLSGITSGEKITYIPLELRVCSTQKIEIVNFDLHPEYKISLVHKLPLEAEDDIKVLLPYFIKHSGSEEFGFCALELEKKVGDNYSKIESMADYTLPKDPPISPETLLKLLGSHSY